MAAFVSDTLPPLAMKVLPSSGAGFWPAVSPPMLTFPLTFSWLARSALPLPSAPFRWVPLQMSSPEIVAADSRIPPSSAVHRLRSTLSPTFSPSAYIAQSPACGPAPGMSAAADSLAFLQLSSPAMSARFSQMPPAAVKSWSRITSPWTFMPSASSGYPRLAAGD